MEIKLFKYRCVVSLKTPFQCCSRLKTKALLHKAEKRNNSCLPTISSDHRVTFQSVFIEKAVRKCSRKGSLSSPPMLPQAVKLCWFRGGRFHVLYTFPAGKTSCSSLSGSSTVHSGNSPHIGIKQLSLDERTPE